MAQIRKQSMKEQIYQIIKDRILNLEYPMDTPLNQQHSTAGSTFTVRGRGTSRRQSKQQSSSHRFYPGELPRSQPNNSGATTRRLPALPGR